jgi:isopentenyl-diphosphate delta-isomerase
MELLDIINNNDEVIGTMTREEAYKHNAALRIAGILVFNFNGLLIIQQRSANKKYPLCFDYSAAGHVLSTESYVKAAARELQEELGILTELFPIGEVRAYDQYNKNKLKKLHRIFIAIHNGPFSIFKDELENILEVDEYHLNQMISNHPDRFAPTFLKVHKEIIVKKRLFGMIKRLIPTCRH